MDWLMSFTQNIIIIQENKNNLPNNKLMSEGKHKRLKQIKYILNQIKLDRQIVQDNKDSEKNIELYNINKVIFIAVNIKTKNLVSFIDT